MRIRCGHFQQHAPLATALGLSVKVGEQAVPNAFTTPRGSDDDIIDKPFVAPHHVDRRLAEGGAEFEPEGYPYPELLHGNLFLRPADLSADLPRAQPGHGDRCAAFRTEHKDTGEAARERMDALHHSPPCRCQQLTSIILAESFKE